MKSIQMSKLYRLEQSTSIDYLTYVRLANYFFLNIQKEVRLKIIGLLMYECLHYYDNVTVFHVAPLSSETFRTPLSSFNRKEPRVIIPDASIFCVYRVLDSDAVLF